jgi:ribosomal protein S18 acetylase RimI-like enzyme
MPARPNTDVTSEAAVCSVRFRCDGDVIEMQFDIARLTSPAQLSHCAALMVDSSPWNQLYFTHAQCESDLARPEMAVHGAIGDAEEIVGFIASAAYGIGFEPIIEYLCVDPRFRSKGIGTKLIDFFEQELFPEADNLYMFVSDINPRAMALYATLGYASVGAFPNFNLETQTEFLFRKARRPRQAAPRAEIMKRQGIAEDHWGSAPAD